MSMIRKFTDQVVVRKEELVATFKKSRPEGWRQQGLRSRVDGRSVQRVHPPSLSLSLTGGWARRVCLRQLGGAGGGAGPKTAHYGEAMSTLSWVASKVWDSREFCPAMLLVFNGSRTIYACMLRIGHKEPHETKMHFRRLRDDHLVSTVYKTGGSPMTWPLKGEAEATLLALTGSDDITVMRCQCFSCAGETLA